MAKLLSIPAGIADQELTDLVFARVMAGHRCIQRIDFMHQPPRLETGLSRWFQGFQGDFQLANAVYGAMEHGLLFRC